ncbi:MAG: alpha/beta hydrolase, partial [Planctomycetota bacterium]
LHGNGEIIDRWAPELSWYTNRGVSVLLPEYRGYGRSAGRPSARAIVADVRAATDRLLALDTVDADRLILHSRSLGGGFAAQLIGTHAPAAVILGSSFTSLPDAARELLPVPNFVVRDKLPVEAELRGYAGPVLILHGQDDAVIPVTHARRNAAAAAHATLVVYERTGHNDMPHGHGRWEDIAAFLAANHLLDGPGAPARSTPGR